MDIGESRIAHMHHTTQKKIVAIFQYWNLAGWNARSKMQIGRPKDVKLLMRNTNSKQTKFWEYTCLKNEINWNFKPRFGLIKWNCPFCPAAGKFRERSTTSSWERLSNVSGGIPVWFFYCWCEEHEPDWSGPFSFTSKWVYVCVCDCCWVIDCITLVLLFAGRFLLLLLTVVLYCSAYCLFACLLLWLCLYQRIKKLIKNPNRKASENMDITKDFKIPTSEGGNQTDSTLQFVVVVELFLSESSIIWVAFYINSFTFFSTNNVLP